MKTNNNTPITEGMKYSPELQAMILNSKNMGDKDFNRNIEFITEEYINDDIPKQYVYKTLQEAIFKAYELYKEDKLHCMGLYDKVKKVYHLTDALNYFIDNENYIQMDKDIRMLQDQLRQHKEFLKKYKSEEIFKEYLKTFYQ